MIYSVSILRVRGPNISIDLYFFMTTFELRKIVRLTLWLPLAELLILWQLLLWKYFDRQLCSLTVRIVGEQWDQYISNINEIGNMKSVSEIEKEIYALTTINRVWVTRESHGIFCPIPLARKKQKHDIGIFTEESRRLLERLPWLAGMMK